MSERVTPPPALPSRLLQSHGVSRRHLLGAALAGPSLAWAQFKVEIAGVGMTQWPLTVAQFRGDDSAPQKIGAIVAADLERSGQFRLVDGANAVLDELARPDLAAWRQRGADYLVSGSVSRLADGRFDVRYRLWDAARTQDLGGASYAVGVPDLRQAAHRIADAIYERVTGDKGVFSTRIAYVTKGAGRHTLWVADADGENAQAALPSSEPIISPAWSPDGRQLAYVSFEARKPVIYAHELASGRRRLLASFRGSNSAPSWAPDGRSLVMTLSRDGGSQLYAMDAAGGEPRRLTQSGSIDTEPVFSADGRTLFFVSDRGGSPQIYRMPAAGGAAERVTFTGTYNISPSPSPDGRWLAYIARVNGLFKLHVQDLGSGAATAITDTSADERPSFAPNSRLIIYATQVQGREALMTTTVDGRIKARLAGQAGDIREPSWGPFQKP